MNYKTYLDRLCERVETTRTEVGDAWPYHAHPTTGEWETTEDGDWCDGHWIDMLRMTGELTNDQSLIEEALQRTERNRYKLEIDDMFRGHRFYYSAARLYQTTGNQEMRTLALAAAYAVRSMAMKVNGAMPVGTEVQVKVASDGVNLKTRRHVCVDNVHPNLMLDWWAWKETNDKIFLDGAYAMFDVVEKHFIREDGSTVEFIEFDPETGEVRKEFTILGYSDDSCWSRGQAWAIAGTMFAYEHTRDPRFLRTCKKVFDYWWDNCGAELPPYDFKDPDAQTLPKDSSSSAIVTAALARLAVLKDIDSEASLLLERLDPMIETMLAKTTPVDDNDKRPVGMLLDGCFNQPKLFANDHELLWGDFYLMETLYCLEKGGMPC